MSLSPGLFNVFNAMLAASVCMKLGIDLDTIAEGLKSVKGVSGRMESLPAEGFDFSVILDFAHTPDGLSNLLSAVQGFAKGRVIAVFGCGGDRDNAKRPIMGATAAKLADFCVVTSDNPRTEDPTRIINMVLEGVRSEKTEYVVIENRREAIRYALNIAKKDDVVVLAGKGHENYQEINGIKHPFDEKIIVAEILEDMRCGRQIIPYSAQFCASGRFGSVQRKNIRGSYYAKDDFRFHNRRSSRSCFILPCSFQCSDDSSTGRLNVPRGRMHIPQRKALRQWAALCS